MSSQYTKYANNIDPILEVRESRLSVWDLNAYPSIPRPHIVFNLA